MQIRCIEREQTNSVPVDSPPQITWQQQQGVSSDTVSSEDANFGYHDYSSVIPPSASNQFTRTRSKDSRVSGKTVSFARQRICASQVKPSRRENEMFLHPFLTLITHF